MLVWFRGTERDSKKKSMCHSWWILARNLINSARKSDPIYLIEYIPFSKHTMHYITSPTFSAHFFGPLFSPLFGPLFGPTFWPTFLAHFFGPLFLKPTFTLGGPLPLVDHMCREGRVRAVCSLFFVKKRPPPFSLHCGHALKSLYNCTENMTKKQKAWRFRRASGILMCKIRVRHTLRHNRVKIWFEWGRIMWLSEWWVSISF